MSKTTAFLLAAFMLCLGLVLGFMASPVKHGIKISIGNNNHDNSSLAGKIYENKQDEEKNKSLRKGKKKWTGLKSF